MIMALYKEIQELKARISSLEKDSTNSHKPPSSDVFKKKRGAVKRGSSGRKPGGQKGHAGKTRLIVPQEGVSATVPHKSEKCGKCGSIFTEAHTHVECERRQVWDIPEIKPFIIEHIFYKTTCDCGYQTRLPVPEWIYSGVGDNLQAHIAYLTSEAKASRRILQTVIENIFRIPIALGTIQNRLENTSEILKPVCDELEDELTRQKVVNIDESSFPHDKAPLCWLWCFITSTFAFFTIRASRGSKVLKQVLGDAFDGIIICDRFSAYIKYHKDRACGLLQFCWAHIIRDVKALKNELANGSDRPFSQLMRRRIGALFKLWHTHKRGKISLKQLIEAAKPLIDDLCAFLKDNTNAPSIAVSKFCKNLLKKRESLFTFIYHAGVEPTNNLAERLIRAGVIMRKISYCTRSTNGQLLRARLLTVSQTCRILDRNVLDFYREAIHAHRNNLKNPSLLAIPQNQKSRIAA
ncbi:IS66 family transposase [Patescibacteria group bacterium]|nr:IS66 family transposase [Patescibacteria group bacterium]